MKTVKLQTWLIAATVIVALLVAPRVVAARLAAELRAAHGTGVSIDSGGVGSYVGLGTLRVRIGSLRDNEVTLRGATLTVTRFRFFGPRFAEVHGRVESVFGRGDLPHARFTAVTADGPRNAILVQATLSEADLLAATRGILVQALGPALRTASLDGTTLVATSAGAGGDVVHRMPLSFVSEGRLVAAAPSGPVTLLTFPHSHEMSGWALGPLPGAPGLRVSMRVNLSHID